MLESIITILLFIVLGIILSTGRGSFLIAGFNTMGKREQEGWDRIALSKFMGKAAFGVAFAMLFTLLSNVFEIEWLDKVSFVLTIGIMIFIIIYANTGNRFLK